MHKTKEEGSMKKQGKICFASLLLLFIMVFGLNAAAAPYPAKLENNVLYKVSNKYYDNHYHTFTVPKDGYITVYGYSYRNDKKYGLGIQLRKSKKQALYPYYTEVNAYNQYKCYYALKKGTYCLAAHGKDYAIKYTFTPISGKGGASRAKAVAVNKGKPVKGLFTVGEKCNTKMKWYTTKTKWYKIRLKKRQRVNLYFTTKTHGEINCEIVSAKTNRVLAKSTAFTRNKTEKLSTRLPAGTYYVKVINIGTEDGDLAPSGYYSLYWK